MPEVRAWHTKNNTKKFINTKEAAGMQKA